MRLKEKSSGIAVSHIRTWALVCVTVGIVGLTVILQGMLGIDQNITLEKMKELFTNDQARHYLITAMICQGVYACAVPLFALLLVEGALHTGDFSKYLIRVFAVALISEVPFDLATRGVFLDITTLNPAFGSAFALVMLMFFLRYCDNSFSSILLRIIITAAVILWTVIMNVEEGPCMVLLTSVLWNFREKPNLRTVFGIVAGLACCVFNMFYVATPLSIVLIRFYNGEKGADFKWGRLAAYPAILALVGLAVKLAF